MSKEACGPFSSHLNRHTASHRIAIIGKRICRIACTPSTLRWIPSGLSLAILADTRTSCSSTATHLLPFIIQFALFYLSRQMTLPSEVDIYSFPLAAAMPLNTGLLLNLISLSFLPSPVEMTWSRAPFLPSRAATWSFA